LTVFLPRNGVLDAYECHAMGSGLTGDEQVPDASWISKGRSTYFEHDILFEVSATHKLKCKQDVGLLVVSLNSPKNLFSYLLFKPKPCG
jgi:hypothetical protein